MWPDNIADVAAAGADTFVAGSAIFKAADYKAVVDQMRANLAPSPRRGHYRHSSRVFSASDRGLQPHSGVAHRAGRCRNPLSAYAKLAQGPRSFLFES